ncbi:MAG: hypothetical protein IKB07_07445 [Lachnospiraceae bacterium]|nr:hypothetical protein [Lachnospiraceae bacterium]
MSSVKPPRFRGFSSYQIKLFAVVFMTIDHLAAYGHEIPIFYTYYNQLRLIGRLAAPLFFFVLTESVAHTRSKPKFLFRLYLAAVGVGLFTTITNFFLGDIIGRFAQSNILFDYFYTALYIILIEQIILAVKEKCLKRGVLAVSGIATTGLVHLLCVLFNQINFSKFGPNFEFVWLLQDLMASFIVSPLYVEYSILFILMGILMYFVKNKFGKAVVLLLFSGICYFGQYIDFLQHSCIGFVLGAPQYLMVLAVPFILFYNGEKGKGQKYFFYLYYPLHRYAISIAVYIYRLFAGV